MFDQTLDMHGVRQLFDTNMRLCFACLYPKFEWFDKRFSIDRLSEPQTVTILKHTIFPSGLEGNDRLILSKIDFPNVIRKYELHVYMDNDDKFTASVFENNDSEVVVVYDSHITVGTDIENVREDFFKKIIRIKSDLDADEETIIIKDENFELFKTLYKEASELYPEEVIKSHDKTQKNV